MGFSAAIAASSNQNIQRTAKSVMLFAFAKTLTLLSVADVGVSCS